MAKNLIFDLSEEQAAKRTRKDLEELLYKHNHHNDCNIDITDVEIMFDVPRNAFTERIDYRILADKNIEIYNDCLTEIHCPPYSIKLSEYLLSRNLSMQAYHCDILIRICKQAKKAYKILKKNDPKVLMPILVRVV